MLVNDSCVCKKINVITKRHSNIIEKSVAYDKTSHIVNLLKKKHYKLTTTNLLVVKLFALSCKNRG